MIRKPAVDWQRESRAAATLDAAVHVARGGANAARSAGHVARGLLCWAAAGLWGYAAFAASAGGAGVGMPIGIGLMAVGIAWVGARAFKKAFDGAAPRGTSPAPPGLTSIVATGAGARSVRYDPPRLVALAVFGVAVACAAVWWLPKLEGFAAVLAGLGAAGCAALAYRCVAKLLGDPTALSYDAQSLTIATLWRRCTIAWADVRSIGVTTTTTYALGFIRTGRTQSLVIKVKGGMTGSRSLSLAGMLLDLDGVGTLMDLAVKLEAFRGIIVSATAPDFGGDHPGDVRGAAEPRRAGASDQEAVFDPDAVIARYLAGKAAAEQSLDAAAGHRFGSPIMNQTPRPFGRRVR